ncbi:hypothetical protein BDR04DRAFT_1087872 [Suillus decipiens]|nr:hypothetical protein BDR04DRAFT_1087872 [Suillus decipiens]
MGYRSNEINRVYQVHTDKKRETNRKDSRETEKRQTRCAFRSASAERWPSTSWALKLQVVGDIEGG